MSNEGAGIIGGGGGGGGGEELRGLARGMITPLERERERERWHQWMDR